MSEGDTTAQLVEDDGAFPSNPFPGARLTIVGIGEDGWAGLGGPARLALETARTIIGSERQLALLPADLQAEREAWPRPFVTRVDELVAAIDAGADPADWTILASGDPMLHGIGSTLAARLDPALLHVFTAPSAYSIACGRLGWPTHTTPLVSRVKDPEKPVAAALRRAGRAIVYVPGASGARDLAAVLRADGLGAARFVVMERVGGPQERITESTAASWDADADPLHLVAVALPVDEDARRSAASEPRRVEGGSAPPSTRQALSAGRLDSTVPGLPDQLYSGDGQLTRAEVRAVALAALAPRPGELLWDVGAGTGTIAIEWCRGAAQSRAVAIERRADRAATVATNAAALGAGLAAGPGDPGVHVVTGGAPEATAGLPTPDAIFIGGGTGSIELVDHCWAAVRPGGRVVANAVTLEGEQALIAAAAEYGGDLIRLDFARAEALGQFTGWKPYRPIVQWSATKEPEPS